jgi:branched-subunit amino acid aminotransferase/4-amino-4-deoxychorismate lyase
LADAPWAFSAGDPLARHKTLNYWSKRLAYEHGRSAGADDVLCTTADGRVWEASRANLFFVRGQTLVTPDLSGPVLPGIMRGLVLELAAGVGLEVREQGVTAVDVAAADEVFLTNSVRGIIPVGRLADRTFEAPGVWTVRLRDRIEQWLQQEDAQP